MKIKAIKERSQLKHSIHCHLQQNGYLEVETPIMTNHLIPEPTIANFATTFISEFQKERELYLIPSPEVHMKPLIKELNQSIYQFVRCFRNNEQSGSYHNSEFTMLEYYSVGCDEIDSIAITEKLISDTALKGTKEHLLPPFKRMSVAQACYEIGKFDLDKCQNITKLRQEVINNNLYLPNTPESWQETFHRLFLNLVEPNLPQDKPLILYDYPTQIACLAKEHKDKPYRKRWELYAGGIELANCYDEEQDYEKVLSYYQNQYALLANQRANTSFAIADVDYSFVDLFKDSFPQCSGVALGFDRLLMLQGDYKRVGDLILFNISDIIGGGHKD